MKKMLLVLISSINIAVGIEANKEEILQIERNIEITANRCKELCKTAENNEELQVKAQQLHNLNIELVYLLSKPAKNCDALRGYVSPILGDNCEIRILQTPAKLLKLTNPDEYNRLHKIFLEGVPDLELVKNEILKFTEQCEFVGLADTEKFKSEICRILIDMSSQRAYRKQIFSAMASAMVSTDSSDQDPNEKIIKFSESDTGSLAVFSMDDPEIQIDFDQFSHGALNTFSNSGINLSTTNVSIDYALYHEIGHFLSIHSAFGDWGKSMEVAGIGRRINVTAENQEFIKNRWDDYASSTSGEIPPELFTSTIEILKDPAKYNAYLFDSKLLALGILDLAQILGFYVQKYQDRYVLYLNKSSDIALSLKNGTPIRSDHLGQTFPDRSGIIMRLDANENARNAFVFDIQNKIGYIDLKFYEAIAVAMGFNAEEFHRCLDKK